MGEGGFALVMVVAMTLTLVLATTAVLSNARRAVAVADGVGGRADLMARADGAVIVALAHVRAGSAPPAEAHGIAVRVDDLGPLPDVNVASLATLRPVLLATGRPEVDDWLEAIASRRRDFAARGVSWHLGGRPIASMRELAALLDLPRDNPLSDRLSIWLPIPAPASILRVRARDAEGRILREAVALVERDVTFLAWD